MSQEPESPEQNAPPVSSAQARKSSADLRAEKRARALRDNLQRRKTQQRGRDQGDSEDTPSDAPDKKPVPPDAGNA